VLLTRHLWPPTFHGNKIQISFLIRAIYYTHGRMDTYPIKTGYSATGSSTYTDTHKTGYSCACKWLLMWHLWSLTFHEKNSKVFEYGSYITPVRWFNRCNMLWVKKIILHRFLHRFLNPIKTGYPATGSSTYTDTHKTGYSCACKWLLMWRLWSLTFHEKNSKSFWIWALYYTG